MTEADFQGTVIAAARAFKWRVAHFRPAMTSKGWRTPVMADGKGFPDLVLVRERVIFAELKVPPRKTTPDQDAWLACLVESGAEVYVWRPADFHAVVATLRRRLDGNVAQPTELLEFSQSGERRRDHHEPQEG
jgi:hypothetical protein